MIVLEGRGGGGGGVQERDKSKDDIGRHRMIKRKGDDIGLTSKIYNQLIQLNIKKY